MNASFRLRMVNMTLLLLLPILVGVLLGMTRHKALASTPGLCPVNIPNPSLTCPSGGADYRPAGYTCASGGGGTFCCQYRASNLYCNGVYYGYQQDIIAANYALPCSNGTCSNFTP